MLSRDDLKRAVIEGIVTEDQSEQLLALAEMRRGVTLTHQGRDEPFRLFRGFRDFFLALGLVILAIGLASGVFISFDVEDAFSAGSSSLPFIGAWLALAALGWALAEWVTARLRLPLSSIVLSMSFAGALSVIGAALAVQFGPHDATNEALPMLVAYLAALLGLVGFYARFGLPFVLLPLAGAAVGTAYWLFDLLMPDVSDMTIRLLFAFLGLLVFIAAMRFDLRDPNRISRASECAFWLHLLAAPLLVHSLIGGFEQGLDIQSDAQLFTMLALIGGLGLLALLIDRRAFLVSALIYLGAAIQAAVEKTGLDDNAQMVATLVALGLFVVVLALGWAPMRRGLMAILPKGGLFAALPPAERPSPEHLTS